MRFLFALHFLSLDVVFVLLLNIANLDAAPKLGENGETKHGKSHGDFLVAGKSSRGYQVANLTLDVKDGATVHFATWTATSTWQQWSAGLAAELHVKAAQSKFS